jgi:hypothetical protein
MIELRIVARRHPENSSTNSEPVKTSDSQATPPSSPGENATNSAGSDEFEIRRKEFFGL